MLMRPRPRVTRSSACLWQSSVGLLRGGSSESYARVLVCWVAGDENERACTCRDGQSSHWHSLSQLCIRTHAANHRRATDAVGASARHIEWVQIFWRGVGVPGFAGDSGPPDGVRACFREGRAAVGARERTTVRSAAGRTARIPVFFLHGAATSTGLRPSICRASIALSSGGHKSLQKICTHIESSTRSVLT
jgi:hypothetical protein